MAHQRRVQGEGNLLALIPSKKHYAQMQVKPISATLIQAMQSKVTLIRLASQV